MTSEVVDFDPFRSGQIERVAPTTEPQREIITSAGLGSEANTAFNEAVSLRIRGPLAVDVVASALQAIVERHEALRMTFTPQLDELCVTSGGRFDLERIDVSTETAERQEEIVQETWQRLANEPMSLTDGPLFRGVWLQLGPEDAELVLLAHHVVCDGWSFHVILQELSRLCAGESPADLPPAPSFADFALEQRLLGANAKDQDFWNQRFATRPAVLDLPTDRARPPRRSFAARRFDHVLEEEARKALVAGAGRMRASVVSVVLSGTAVLLHRLTEATDVTIGLPVARQGVGGPEGLVGHAVQLLPIRLTIDPEGAFQELVQQVKSAVLDATEHHDFTYGTLVRAIGLSGDVSRVPLNPVVFNIDQPFDSIRFGDAVVTIRSVPRTADSFEMFLNVVPSRDRFVVEATYNTGLFEVGTIASWMRALERLLLAGSRQPETKLAALPLSNGASSGDNGLRGREAPIPVGIWLASLRETARRTPDRRAVISRSGSSTYVELRDQIDDLARVLASRGVGEGAIVGVHLQRTHRLPAALGAIHSVGAAFLPLDPHFPEERLSYMLQDSGACLVLTDGAGADSSWAVPSLRLTEIQLAGESAPRVPELPQLHGTDDRLAYLIYTSGSTGKPKGVAVGHRALSNFLASMAVQPGFPEGQTLLSVTTISFDISILELLLPLTNGGTVVVASRDDARNPTALAQLLTEFDVGMMQATPATWRMLLLNRWRGKADLLALCGGEPLPSDLANDLRSRVAALWNMYGPTETTIWSTCTRVTGEESRIHVGRPIANTTVHVLSNTGESLPPGFPGEICIGGAGLAVGYHGRPALTAEKFIAVEGLGRLYRTGDKGRLAVSGELYCAGRLDQQVKVRGFRIELGEIEAVLSRAPGVRQAAVAVQKDARGEPTLRAFLVGPEGERPDLDAIRQHVARYLPDYMIPQAFLWLDVVPLLPNGKVDRSALPQGAPGEAAPSNKGEPASDLERTIVQAMEKMLGAEVGVTDNFFQCGGHSLLAAQLAAQLAAELAITLTIVDVFTAPTARLLAGTAAERAVSTVRRIEIARAQDRREAAVTPMQERMWMLQHAMPQSVAQNLPSAHRLRGCLDEAAFQKAFDDVIRTQAVLRTSITMREGRLVQVVAHDVVVPPLFPSEDLSRLERVERERVLRERLDLMVAEPFDLSRAPLMRARMFRMSEEEHVFFFMPHHTIWDGYSFDLLYEQMGSFYARRRAGVEDVPAALPATFSDYAEWLQDRRASVALVAEREYWRARLTRFGTVPKFPADRERPPGLSGRAEHVWVKVDNTLTEALRSLAMRAGTTLYSALVCAYGLVLANHSRRDKVVLGMPARGREAPEMQHVMGCCLTYVPLPLSFDRNVKCSEALHAIGKGILDSLAHSYLITLPEKGDQEGWNYHSLFSFQDVRKRPRAWGDLQHEMVHVMQQGAVEDLALWLLDTGNGLQGALVYNAEIYERSTLEAFTTRFLRILHSMTASPSCMLGQALADSSEVVNSAVNREHQVRHFTPATAPQAVSRTHSHLTDTEMAMATVWQRVLGSDKVQKESQFFELGGTSLSVIQVAIEFENAGYGRVEIGDIYRFPRLDALCRYLSSAHTVSRSFVVPLQPNGQLPPVFCLRGLGIYSPLAQAMGSERPVVGVYLSEEDALARDAIDNRATSLSIRDLARSYCDAIVAHRKKSPYLLAGLSQGGVLAMEAARQLIDRGHRVECVILFDTILPQGAKRTLIGKIRRCGRLLLDRGVQLVASLGVRRRAMNSQRIAVAMRRQHAANERAVAAWANSFEAPPVRTILFRSDDAWPMGRHLQVEEDYGWRSIMGNQLEIVRVNGDHLGMLQQPGVASLAEAVLNRLPREADAS